MPEPDRILTVAQVKAAERALFDDGLEPYALMQRAGRATADWVWRISGGRPVTVLCGPGNNGGDGYVIAQTLHERGCDVAVIAMLPPATPDCERARSEYSGRVDGREKPRSGDTIVDCIFGTGQNRALSDDLSAAVRYFGNRHARSVAIDIPTGIESDTAMLLDCVAPHDATLALGAWKWAHWATPAISCMGRRILVDIGLVTASSTARPIGRPRIPAPSPDAHKYSRGLVAVVAGEMPGAALLAARAAQSSGAGYVKLLTGAEAPAHPDSLVVDRAPLAEALDDDRISTILVGPGLGRSPSARKRLRCAIEAATKASLVIDADALHLLEPGDLARLGDRVVLTPHEGELAKLAETFISEAHGEAFLPPIVSRASAVASSANAIVVAKGHTSFACHPDGSVRAAGPASSWLAAAGTGDVLAGLLASRLATGSSPIDAASEGLWLHSEAARLAGPALTADDLVRQTRNAMAQCQAGTVR